MPGSDLRGMAPPFLLVVRESLTPGSLAAYDENERRIAAAARTHGAPHPYVALAAVDAPTEVWWLTAFASATDRDAVEAAFTRNALLMAALTPLAARKEAFRTSITTSRLAHRPELGGGAGLSLAGARFLVVETLVGAARPSSEVFESSDGTHMAVTSAATRAAAEAMAASVDGGAVILAVMPQWSHPDETWVRDDPLFWRPGDERPRPRTSNGESKNLTAITPFFIVRDLATAIACYRDRLGFDVEFTGPPDDVYYAQVRRDGAAVMLKAVAPDVRPAPNRSRHPSARWDAYVYTQDPDTLFAELSGRGATFVTTLSWIDDGLWGFEVADADGYVLAFFCVRDA